jgi:hypothetical protein
MGHQEPLTPPFTAQKGQDDHDAIVLANMDFFPDIHLRDFQTRYKVDNSHGEDKQIQSLQNAMHRINKQLLDDMATEKRTNWVCEQVRKGYLTLDKVPSMHYGNCSEKVSQYLTAIYALAKANLVSKYRDIDTTRRHGQEKAAELESTEDDYRQESRESLRLLMDKPRVTIDLI